MKVLFVNLYMSTAREIKMEGNGDRDVSSAAGI